ncbi:MAG TPA: TetR/AcrR family transcriptional regulator [Pseudonocardiaceae bacterium]|nr:TetR/AcrR family transcriptional regulator [Pseudonocardiaceae bacterium]
MSTDIGVSQGANEAPGPTRREQILAAAAELFARRGFHGVGIDDIGAAVGISGPALYRHFRSKDAMLGEMLRSISEYLLAGGQRKMSEADDPANALPELVGFHIDFALDNSALITVQERDLANLTEPDRHQVRTLQRQYVEVWVHAIRASVPDSTERAARAAAHAVFGLLNSTPHSAGAELDRDDLAALLHRMTMAAVLTPNTL